MKKLKIILVVECELSRKKFSFLLESEYSFDVIGEVSNAKEFFKLDNISETDLVIVDVKTLSHTALELSQKYNDLRIIAVSQEINYCNNLLAQSGFKACISKYKIHEQIVPAVKKVMNGEYYFPTGSNLKISNKYK